MAVMTRLMVRVVIEPLRPRRHTETKVMGVLLDVVVDVVDGRLGEDELRLGLADDGDDYQKGDGDHREGDDAD